MRCIKRADKFRCSLSNDVQCGLLNTQYPISLLPKHGGYVSLLLITLFVFSLYFKRSCSIFFRGFDLVTLTTVGSYINHYPADKYWESHLHYPLDRFFFYRCGVTYVQTRTS